MKHLLCTEHYDQHVACICLISSSEYLEDNIIVKRKQRFTLTNKIPKGHAGRRWQSLCLNSDWAAITFSVQIGTLTNLQCAHFLGVSRQVTSALPDCLTIHEMGMIFKEKTRCLIIIKRAKVTFKKSSNGCHLPHPCFLNT